METYLLPLLNTCPSAPVTDKNASLMNSPRLKKCEFVTVNNCFRGKHNVGVGLFIQVLFVFLFINGTNLRSQVVINEASNRNYTQILDEDGETNDWLELYNASDSVVNLYEWSLSDDISEPQKWRFPNINFGSGAFLVVFASDKDRTEYIEPTLWETAINATDTFSYIVPDSLTSNLWNVPDYDDQTWDKGPGGFGFGDDDDNTIIDEGTSTVYIRKNFTITDTVGITKAVCHMDYDDGFVAYLNGIEICRSNVSGTPTWSTLADSNHEAEMPGDGLPEAFDLDMDLIRSVWKIGENTFAAEVHNVTTTSSDLSLVPYLSFGAHEQLGYFGDAPSWLTNTVESSLHTNFKIASEGETIYLFNAQNVLVDSLQVTRNNLNYSVGRSTDGANSLAVFMQATPNATNNTSTPYTNGYEATPTFSLQAGFYYGTQSVTINNQSTTGEIRYTTDGSEPTINSLLYSGTAIELSETTTINARCFSTSDKLPSFTKTATFFINEEFTVPVLAVTTDDYNLYGDSGIFTNYNEEWNKPCYMEYFDENKQLVISQAAGIQVDGGAGGSRSKPQTSFRVEPGNGTFGDGDVKYSFHPERPTRDNYESLYLRNGSNQYLTYFCKDAIQVRGMGKNTYNFYSEYRPIVVFINGGYYGLYEGREKINEDYLKSNYDLDTDSLNIVGISHFKQPKTILPIVGSTDSFFADYDKFLALDPSSDNYLEEVGKILDLDNYTDYIAGEIWMTNKDWPYNNMKAWQCKGTGMRWQFAIVDLEWSFLPTNTNANLATDPSFDQIDFMNGLTTEWPASGFWYNLMQNDDYKHYFINRLCDLMNTSYDYEVLNEIETEVYQEALPEIPAEYLRWDGGTVDDFTANHEIFNNQLSLREDYLRLHLRNHYDLTNDVEITLDVEPDKAGKIKISTIMPDDYPWTGEYFSDVPISFEAIPNPGFTFSSWDSNAYITDVTSNSFTTEISDLSTMFIANFEVAQSSFEGVTISEINYKDGSDFNTTDWFEIWNATSETLSLDGWYFYDNDSTHRFDFVDGTTIAPQDRLVVVKSSKNFSNNYPDVTNFTGDFSFGLGTPTDEINLFNEHDELVASVSYSDNYPWALNNDLTGRTLELLDPLKSLDDADNWFAGCYMGSPGEPFDVSCMESSTSNESIASVESGIQNLSLYPNPATDVINLEFILEDQVSSFRVEIFDMLGTLVLSDDVENVYIGRNIITLDINNLVPNQIYFVSVTSDQFRKVFKVIKK